MKKQLIFFFYLFSVSFAYGADEAQIFKCTHISNNVLRLQCFDEAAKTIANKAEKIAKNEALENTNIKKTGKWDINTNVSKIDDTTNVFLKLESENTALNKFRREKRLELAIMCRENKLSLIIDFAGNFMASGYGRGKVTYRIDKLNAKEIQFTQSNDHSVLGLWDKQSSTPFISELLRGKKLFVQATPFSDSAVSGEFELEGLTYAIEPIKKACSWEDTKKPSAKPKVGG